MTIEFSKKLTAHETPIPGVVLFDLPVHGDNRGWFKENWQREKMVALGLPDFGPVQNNISFNDAAGTTRGIHAEPWDKFVSVATGRIFGAWVDLREGPTFGAVFTAELDPQPGDLRAPRRRQRLPDAGGQHRLHLPRQRPLVRRRAGPVHVPEPRRRDRGHQLADPAGPGRALRQGPGAPAPGGCHADAAEEDPGPRRGRPARQRAARTVRRRRRRRVRRPRASSTSAARPPSPRGTGRTTPRSSTPRPTPPSTPPRPPRAARPRGRSTSPPSPRLARTAVEHGITLVHVSSDYVFDGTREAHARGRAALARSASTARPKPPGDAVVSVVPRHYIVRTSWVIGDGNNFVRTMASLAERGIEPSVVDDQFGRLSFTDDIAARHPAPARDGRPLRHLQPQQRRGPAVLGRHRGRCVRTPGKAPGRRHRCQHRGLLPRKNIFTPAAEQRAGSGPDRPPRASTPRRRTRGSATTLARMTTRAQTTPTPHRRGSVGLCLNLLCLNSCA